MAACQDLFENDNVSNEELEGLLFQSCRDGQRDVVERLLSKGVRLDVKDKDGRSPLVVSSMSGWEDIVSLILDQGVDVVENRDGSTALMEACKNGHLKVVKILVERGANQNEEKEEGTTPLIEACMNGHKNVVEFLIEYVSDVNERDNTGRTPLMWACINGHHKVVEFLIQYVSDVDERDDTERTALMWACINEREKVVEKLVEHGARLDATDYFGNTPLIIGCWRLHVAIVKLLIELGTDINVGNKNGVTPLMTVCGNDAFDFIPVDESPAVAMLLLKHGAKVDTQDNEGCSAVMKAVRNNNVGCLQVLLTQGSNLDLVDLQGNTVFTYAMRKKECLRILLEDGRLLHGGIVKSIHKNTNIDEYVRESPLLIAIEFGVFEWEWCPLRYFKPVTLAAIRSGLSPGRIKYNSDTYLSPLVISVLDNDTELTETILDRLYYYPEDYRTLCRDMDVKGRVENIDILDNITLQPLSLQTWCYLNVSKAISTTCFPVKRRERVDALPIPDKCKRRLNFE